MTRSRTLFLPVALVGIALSGCCDRDERITTAAHESERERDVHVTSGARSGGGERDGHVDDGARSGGGERDSQATTAPREDGRKRDAQVTPGTHEGPLEGKATDGNGSLTDEEARTLCLGEPTGASTLDAGIRKYQQLASRLPRNADAWIRAGQGWVRKARTSFDPGFYVNVESCARMALAAEPRNSAALALRSLALMNDHKFEEARTLAVEILGLDPEDTLALATLSDALLELGRFEEAAAAAQKLMDTKPGMAAYARASHFRWLQGDRANAKGYIRDALKAGRDGRDPEPTAWALVDAAMIYWHEADYEGADAVFSEALKWVPDYPSALVGRARVALALGHPARAIECLERAYRMIPLPETAWLLGDAREMSGDREAARTEYDRVVRHGRSRDRLALALFYATKDRDHDEALRLIEEERRTRAGVYIDDAHAWALYRAGRLAEARSASERAMRLGTKDARLLYHAGAIRIASGDASGRALVAQALVLNPKFDWTGAAEAARLLESHENRVAQR